MAATGGSSKKSMVIALDGHKLGHIAGAVVAFTVLTLLLVLGNADALTTFRRVGWSFVVSYGATFYLVRVILKTTLTQLALDKRTALQEKRERHREQRKRGETLASSDETPEAETAVEEEPGESQGV